MLLIKRITTGCNLLRNCPATMKSDTINEKKELAKKMSKARRQQRKRDAEDFVHYENSSVSDYYIDGKFRKVYPYQFTFKAYAKRRWIDRSLTEVLQSEFTFTPTHIIEQKCNCGDILVNNQLVKPDYIFKDSDLIAHRVHRHELPVLNSPIDVVYEDNDILVINKPSSIPIHPCGQYTLNSITHILAREYNRRPLRFCHRLDRMTSGLVLIAKNYDSALRLTSQISDRQVKKYYVCHLDGYFAGDANPTAQNGLPNSCSQVVICEQPLGPLCSRMGIHAVMSEENGGKPAKTHFIRLAYDPKTSTSLVLCRLFTGRTHQIRVHAQYLGHPIVKDPLYNTDDWGEFKGKGGVYGVSTDELITKLGESRTINSYLEDSECSEAKRPHFDEPNPPRESLPESVLLRLKESFDPHCLDCQRKFKEPTMDHLILRLHAFRYAGPSWSYSAPLPNWATEFLQTTTTDDLNSLVEAAILKLE